MKIDHIDVHHLRYEYPLEKRFSYAGGTCTARLTSLIRVHTDTGQVGLGTAYTHPGIVELVVKHQMEPLLRGQDPTAVEFLWDRMYAVTRWYGRKGAALTALGGLDMAFWDLRGKALDKPLRELLGGGRNSVPAYASALLWCKDVKDLAQESARHVARGFRRMKMRLGRSEDYDVAAVDAVKQALGADHDLMVDASMRYTVPLARRMGKFLAEHKVFWFEEPFIPEDIDSYCALRGSVPVRVAAGENEFGVQGFRELIRSRAVDIIQADASRCGGVSEAWKSARLAADAGLEFAPHSWSDALAVMANAHIVAAMPNGLTVEADQTGTPFIEELLVEPLRIRDGQLLLSDRPGAWVAAATKRIKLGTGTINMPNTHPGALAGSMAMLDHMLDGRLIFGISPGGLLSDAELFGNLEANRNEMFLEAINQVLEIWASEPPYNLNGKYWNISTQKTLIGEIGQGFVARPLQRPHPPIVVTAVAPFSKGVTEAAARGWDPISANFLMPAWVKSHWPKYVEGCERGGRAVNPANWRVGARGGPRASCPGRRRGGRGSPCGSRAGRKVPLSVADRQESPSSSPTSSAIRSFSTVFIAMIRSACAYGSVARLRTSSGSACRS